MSQNKEHLLLRAWKENLELSHNESASYLVKCHHHRCMPDMSSTKHDANKTFLSQASSTVKENEALSYMDKYLSVNFLSLHLYNYLLLLCWEIWKHLRRSALAPTPAQPERSRGPSLHRRRRRPPPWRWCCRGSCPPACSRRWPPARSPHRPLTPAHSPAAPTPTLCVKSTPLHCLLHTLIISCHRSWHEYKRCEL